MLTLFYALVIEQILQGVYSLYQGFQWLRMARRRIAMASIFYTPRIALICPLKGIEPGLEQNLRALTEFEYVQYEIFFALASAEDPAYPLVERLAATSKRPVHIVRAGRPRDCGEKVNNLRVAVEQAGQRFDVLVFVDSDGRPPRRWLNHLVAPLADERVGAATTFRWLIPDGGFWSAMASAWDAPIATYLGEHRHNFCWGGGTAVRRERFEEVHAAEAWSGSLSDDFSLTGALRDSGFPIAFVPECLVASPCHLDARGFFQFTTRQLMIARVYAPKIWMRATIGHLLYSTAVLLGLGLWAARWIQGFPSLQILLLALVPPVLSAMRGVLRLVAVLDILPEWRESLLTYGWAWTLLAPLAPFFGLYSGLVAAFRRKMVWRGVRYELLSSRHTRILSR